MGSLIGINERRNTLIAQIPRHCGPWNRHTLLESLVR